MKPKTVKVRVAVAFASLLPCPFCGSKQFDDPHDSNNTPNHFGQPDTALWHEGGCWLGRMTIIKLGRNHPAAWNKRVSAEVQEVAASVENVK